MIHYLELGLDKKQSRNQQNDHDNIINSSFTQQLVNATSIPSCSEEPKSSFNSSMKADKRHVLNNDWQQNKYQLLNRAAISRECTFPQSRWERRRMRWSLMCLWVSGVKALSLNGSQPDANRPVSWNTMGLSCHTESRLTAEQSLAWSEKVSLTCPTIHNPKLNILQAFCPSLFL